MINYSHELHAAVNSQATEPNAAVTFQSDDGGHIKLANDKAEGRPNARDEINRVTFSEISIPNYRIIDTLGYRTFSSVLLAVESNIGDRLVVIKFSPVAEREARTLGRLQCCNVVTAYSLQRDESSGLQFLVMEYVGRASLARVMQRIFDPASEIPSRADGIADAIRDINAIDASLEDPCEKQHEAFRGSYIRAVIHLGIQVAEALAFAHSKRCVHRALKPSNIILTPQGRPLLTDFHGTASDCAGLPYMAPEKLRWFGIRDVHDIRCDIFSLGAILYEMLSGQPPFGPVKVQLPLTNRAVDLFDQKAMRLRPLQSINPQVDPISAHAIERCLSRWSSERFRSMNELADVLKKALPKGWRH